MIVNRKRKFSLSGEQLVILEMVDSENNNSLCSVFDFHTSRHSFFKKINDKI